jgi:DNA recombination-dependent growth factor C
MLRNANIYICTAAEPPSAEAMANAIDRAHWTPLSPGQVEGMGFDGIEQTEDRSLDLGPWVVGRVRHTQRKVSSQAVRESADDRVADAEQRNGGIIRNADRREIMDLVRAELTRSAPPESVRRWFAYHPQRRLIVMDGTRNQCEATLSLLRGELGSLGVKPAAYGLLPDTVMTTWLKGESPPANCGFGESCDMRHPQDTANKVRFRAHYLGEEDVRAALDSGMWVTALELLQHTGAVEPLEFVLTDDGALKRIRHPFVEIEDSEHEDQFSRLHADLSLGLGNILGIVDLLTRELGGMPEMQEAQEAAA